MRILVLILLLTGCSAAQHTVVEAFNVNSPRPFGYHIGDEIPQQIIVQTQQDVELQAGSLPLAGKQSYWLELKQVKLQKTESATGWRYVIDLTYQVFYAPLEVKMLKIPGFTLHFSQYGKLSSQAVPDWSFTIAPLRELAVRKSEEGEYMRPAATPDFMSGLNAQRGFYLGLLTSTALLAYLAYLYGFIPQFQRRSIFKRAWRRINALQKPEMAVMLLAMHQAFNQVFGRPLFAVQLAEFLQRYPEYRSIAAQLQWFFSYSNRFHFSTSMIVVEDDLQQLKALCQYCRKIEQGRK